MAKTAQTAKIMKAYVFETEVTAIARTEPQKSAKVIKIPFEKLSGTGLVSSTANGKATVSIGMIAPPYPPMAKNMIYGLSVCLIA